MDRQSLDFFYFGNVNPLILNVKPTWTYILSWVLLLWIFGL